MMLKETVVDARGPAAFTCNTQCCWAVVGTPACRALGADDAHDASQAGGTPAHSLTMIRLHYQTQCFIRVGKALSVWAWYRLAAPFNAPFHTVCGTFRRLGDGDRTDAWRKGCVFPA